MKKMAHVEHHAGYMYETHDGHVTMTLPDVWSLSLPATTEVGEALADIATLADDSWRFVHRARARRVRDERGTHVHVVVADTVSLAMTSDGALHFAALLQSKASRRGWLW